MGTKLERMMYFRIIIGKDDRVVLYRKSVLSYHHVYVIGWTEIINKMTILY